MKKIEFAIFLIALFTTCLSLHAGDLKLSVGAGYDYISSDYYLLTEDTLSISADSLESLKRSSEASNEVGLIGRLRFNHELSDISRLEIYNRGAITNESFKNNFEAGLYIGYLSIENRLDVRNRDESDDEQINQDYISNLTSATFRPHLGHDFYLRIKNAYEFIRYNNPEEYLYDYNYNRLNLELEKDFGFEGRLSIGYRNDVKKVSDSARLEYDRHAFLLSGEYSPSWMLRIRIDNDFSVKDSKKEDRLDDETLENFEVTINYDPAFDYGFRFYSQLEYTAYDTQDLAYFDQIYYRGELEAKRAFGDKLELSLTPHFRMLSAASAEFGDQDFYEYSLEPGVSYNAGLNFWLDISYEIGRRTYPNQLEGFFTDHTLNKFNLFLDALIYGNLNFNLMASIDWENHNQPEDNTRLYFISTTLEYKF
jgi:hypothetical protein